jgi:UDP-glucose 4-epimerase
MPPKTWLITGGAGYVGSHVADAFLRGGHEVLIYDSLHRGLESRIEYLRTKHRKNIPLVIGDIRDYAKLEETLVKYSPHGIVHTAALKSVEESMLKPDEYLEVNFQATRVILELAEKYKIKNFIFSSTAAVYGTPDHLNPVKEIDAKNPISPYGISKLAAEGEVNEFLNLPFNRGTSLRFFNAVGAGSPELMDNSTSNLIPIVINRLNAGEPPIIFGTDYPTPDGTCIRDYVDVRDIASAHLFLAETTKNLSLAINVGTSRGNSVREVIRLVSNAADVHSIFPIERGRRSGDSAMLLADVSLMKNDLGFSSEFSLEESVNSLFTPKNE